MCQVQPRAPDRPHKQSVKEKFILASVQINDLELESGEAKSVLFEAMPAPELYLRHPDSETRVLCTTPYSSTLWGSVLLSPHGTQETETRDSDLGSCHGWFPKWAFVLLRTVLTLPGRLPDHPREVCCILSPHLILWLHRLALYALRKASVPEPGGRGAPSHLSAHAGWMRGCRSRVQRTPPEAQGEPACAPAPTKCCRHWTWGQEKDWDTLTSWKSCVKENSSGGGWGRRNLESLAHTGMPPHKLKAQS